MAKILTAEQLIEERLKTTKKQLPSFGPKDFCVTGSEEEKEKIHNVLSTTKALLACERVEKSNFLSNAEWDNDLKLAKVTKKVGKFFETFGHSINGCDYLYPEECLFLLENSNLELFFCGLAVSIQRGYSLLLGFNSGCTLNEYRVYAHLSKSGYRVFRHDGKETIQNKESSSSFVPSEVTTSGKEAIPRSDITAETLAKSPTHTELLKISSSSIAHHSPDKIATIDQASSVTKVTNQVEKKEIICKPKFQPQIRSQYHFYEFFRRRDDDPELAKIRQVDIDAFMMAFRFLLKNNKTVQSEVYKKSFRIKLKLAYCLRFYPPVYESLQPFSTYHKAMRWQFIQPEDLERKHVTAFSYKPPGLIRDSKFAAIVELFPTFDKGEIYAPMPPNQIIPTKIRSKFLSATINLETNKITHRTCPAEKEFTSVLQNFVRPNERHKNPTELPNSSGGPQPTRYFSQPVQPKLTGRQRRGGLSKKQMKRLRRVENFKKRQEKLIKEENLSNQKQKKFPNSVTGNQSASGARGERRRDGSRWDSRPDNSNTQTHHQIQVKPEFQSISSSNQTDESLTHQPFMNQPQMNQSLMGGPVKPEFPSAGQIHEPRMNQPFMNQPFPNQPVLSQPFMNQPIPNLPPISQTPVGGQTPLNNPVNPLDPGVLGQVIANVVSQLLPNQMNPSLPNQINPNFVSAAPQNFQHSLIPGPPNPIFPNFPNPMNSDPHNQINPPFPNPNNPNFFNQPQPNFRFQNYNPRFPSQRFPRPYNNHGNNNGEMSEVTRQARKMQGMARRMMAMAQAMFKNPEEFAENPEKINMYNYSNRFRHPNNQGNWRFPNQMQNQNNNQNLFRPRFGNNYNNFNPNFNPNFGSNSFNPNMPENSQPHFSHNPDNSARPRDEEDNGYGSAPVNEIPETKFNPGVPRSSSNSSPPGEENDIFFVDVAGENPSNLLNRARTIPACKPTVTFKKEKPDESSSSSSSESESDEDDIEVIEQPTPKPVVETIDVLSSDEDTFISIASKVRQSKSEADRICSKFGRAWKKKNSDERYNDVTKRRRIDDDTELITLDDDVVILDSDSSQPAHSSEKTPQNAGAQNMSNPLNMNNPADGVANEGVITVKQESIDVTRVKTENESEATITITPLDVPRIKEEKDAASDATQETAMDSIEVPIKSEILEVNEAEIERVNQNIGSNLIENTAKVRNVDSSFPATDESGSEDESTDRSSASGEHDTSRDSEIMDTSSNRTPSRTSISPISKDQPTAGNSQSVADSQKVGWAALKAKETNETSSTSTIDSSKVVSTSLQGWAALKRDETNKASNEEPNDLSSVENSQKGEDTNETSRITTEAVESTQPGKITDIGTNQETTSSESNEMEINSSQTNQESEISNTPSSPQEKGKMESLLQPYHCKNLGTALSALQIFKSKVREAGDFLHLKVSFDVYQPKKVFAKVSRSDPDFRIIVTSYLDPVPSPAQINELSSRYSDNVKILFAVVHPNTISFFFIGNVHVPVQIDEVLF
nr:PREDICTED: homeobox protein 2 [Bemisia tabaci]